MKVLVTGNAGFLGSHLVDDLVEQGHKVYGIDNLSGGFRANLNQKALNSEIDLQSKTGEMEVATIKPEILFYLAADAREGRSQFTPISATENNLMAYVNCLTACIKYGVKKVVFTSSMSVYGDQKPPFDESMGRKPVDVYGVNKAACEQVTEILASVHGFEYVITRPHNVFGERQHIADPYRNVIGIWINRIMNGKPPVIYGDGEQKRSFTHIDNFTRYFVKTGFQDNCNGEIINIGPEEEYTINYACEVVLKAMGSDLKPVHAPDRPLEVKNAWTTADKAKKLLGYKTTTTFEEGVKKMVEWARKLGPQPFEYLDDLEIVSDSVPTTWSKKTL